MSQTLTWETSIGATSYEYCYDTTNDNACTSWVGNGAITSKVVSGLSANTTYYWQVRAINIGGETYANGDTWWSFTTINAPTVLSITRASANPTKATSVKFIVTFSSVVTGVDKTDFALATTGSITKASISAVSGKGATRIVTVRTGAGSGTILLNLIDNDSIKDASLIPLGGAGAVNGDFTSGDRYTVDKTKPTVLSIVRASANPTSASSVSFTVTFSEPVTGVDIKDFKLSITGLTKTFITGVTGSGDTYTVTASTGTGTSFGTLRLNVVNNRSIKDAALNSLGAGFRTGEVYTVDKPPVVVSILRASSNPTKSATVKFKVIFSESVTGVDVDDFKTYLTGTLTGTSIVSVIGSGTTWTVTVNTGTGSGVLRLDLIDNDSIMDATSNLLGGVGMINGDYIIGQAFNVR